MRGHFANFFSVFCIHIISFRVFVFQKLTTNIANFGAFVDMGVHKDGLVHISEMANRRISNPNEVVSLHQHVRVRVVDIDKGRGRIQLSLKI